MVFPTPGSRRGTSTAAVGALCGRRFRVQVSRANVFKDRAGSSGHSGVGQSGVAAGLITRRSEVQILPPLLDAAWRRAIHVNRAPLDKRRRKGFYLEPYSTAVALPPTVELVGILLGGGSISKYPSEKYSTIYRTKVTLCADEVSYIRHVRQLMERVLGTEPKEKRHKNSRAVDIQLRKKEVVVSLLELGMELSPKGERARIPWIFMIPELGHLVLRGYFDTDGCVAIVNNNGIVYPRLEMKISPGPFQAQLVALPLPDRASRPSDRKGEGARADERSRCC